MSKIKQQYRSIKQRMFAMGNAASGMQAFFNRELIDTIQKYAPKLSKEPFFRSAFIGKGYPTAVADIGCCGNMLLFSELDKTLLWYTLALSAEAQTINAFLELKAKYEKAFLIGEYDSCLELLDEVHDRFGCSLWEIKKRIAVLNERDRLDSQKKYTNSTVSEFQNGSVFAYTINCYSKKCERNISVGAFNNMIESDYTRFIANEVPVLLCKYARFKAGGSISIIGQDDMWLTEEAINFFLWLDDKCPIIDRYLSLRDIATSLYVCGRDELFSKFIPFFERLKSDIRDPFLSNTCFLWKHGYYPFHTMDNDAICNVFDLYSRGEYAACVEQTKKLLVDTVTFFPLIEVFAKSSIYLVDYCPIVEDRAVIDVIARKLKQLFARAGDIRDIQIDLTKILYAHLDSNWAMELLQIIEKYNNRLTVLEECKMYSLYSSISTPEQIFSFDQEYLHEYLDSATNSYKESASTKLAIAVRTNNSEQIDGLDIDYVRKQKYKAGLLCDTNPNDTLILADEILSCEVNHAVYLEISALRIQALLRTGKVSDAIEVFVKAFLENSNFVYIGSIDEIFKEIKHGEYDLSGSILVPIICSIYFNYFPGHDDSDDIVLSVCYDEYLESLGVEKPSDLLPKGPDNIEDTIFNRFLAEVCVPSVMERSLAFATDDDILRERNVICEALAERDPDNCEKYKEEIRRHTNTLLVRLAKREIDTGKIYIDVEAVRTLLAQSICESFERYIEHRNNNLEEQVFEILNQIIKSETDKTFCLVRQIKQTEMLEDIVKKARDTFVADNKYGLDGCLSVRIRHGTLESQLRSCFEKHKLITTKAVDGSYNPNTAWIMRPSINTDVRDQIDAIFTNFSQKIDWSIQNLKKELIQIRTEGKNPNGLFDFSIDAEVIAYIEAQTYSKDTFEEFERFIIDFLMSIAESSLNEVRRFLNSDINQIFQDALRDLEKELQQFKGVLNVQGIRAQIANARTDISTELKKIAEWFRLSQPDTFIDYDLSFAAQISYSTFQHSHPACSLRCDFSNIDRSFKLKGQTLRSLVDILIILLDNATKHSGLDEGVSAEIRVTRKAEKMVLTVSNPVRSGSISTSRLEEITEHLDNWEKQGYTSREGGSGLYKIKKILSVDLQCQNSLQLSCENDVFCVKIAADLEGVIL